MDATTITSPPLSLSPYNLLPIISQLDLQSTAYLQKTHRAVRDALAHLPAYTHAILTGKDICLNGREIIASHLRDLLNLRVRQCLFPEKASHPPTSSLKIETLPLLIKVIENRIVEINHGDEVQYRKVFAQAIENKLAAVLECLLSSPHFSKLDSNDDHWFDDAFFAICENGLTDIAQLIIQSEKFVEIDDQHFGWAFKAACEHGRTYIVQMLMQSEKFGDIGTRCFGHAFHTACKHNRTDTVQMLMQSGKFMEIDIDEFGLAFCATCEHGHTKIVQMLMQSGKFMDFDDWWFGRAFQTACEYGCTDTIQMLMQSEQFGDMNPFWSRTALNSVPGNEHIEIITNQHSGY